MQVERQSTWINAGYESVIHPGESIENFFDNEIHCRSHWPSPTETNSEYNHVIRLIIGDLAFVLEYGLFVEEDAWVDPVFLESVKLHLQGHKRDPEIVSALADALLERGFENAYKTVMFFRKLICGAECLRNLICRLNKK